MHMPITRRSQLPVGGLGADDASIMSAISSFGRQIAGDQIKGVFFRSSISPDIQLDPSMVLSGQPRSVSEGGFGELFLRFAKPAVYLDTNLGAIRIAPWGDPTINLFPVILLGTVAAGAVIAGLIVKGLRK